MITMADQGAVFEVQLRRMETSQPWGFRLRGGTDQGIPLHVEHVSADTPWITGAIVLLLC